MKQAMVLWVSSTCLLAAACMDEVTPEASGEPVAQLDRICGDRTVASARAPSGNRVVFCVDDGVEVVAEGGVAAQMPVAEAACGLDVFLALTDASTPVPAQLVAACAARGTSVPVFERRIVDEPVFAFDTMAPIAYASTSFAVDYCGTDGQQNFIWEQDYHGRCVDSRYCAVWNKSDQTTMHLKSSHQDLGEQVNVAQSTLSSCNGSTTFQGWRDRGAADSSFTLLLDVDVPARWSWYLSMTYTPSNGTDAHFQFRGESHYPAKHMYAGRFEDYK